MKKKLRPLSQITLDLECLLEELTNVKGHDLQWHEVLALVHQWLQTHAPHARESYVIDGSHPEFYYGHRDGLK